MSRRPLSDKVISARMVELRNLRQLHSHDRKHIAQLKAENQELCQLLNRALEENKTAAIQIAELQVIVFGKNKKKKCLPSRTVALALPITPSSSRIVSSNRRLIPPVGAVTNIVVAPLPKCCACDGTFVLASITSHVYYVEDIPLPDLATDYQPHLVTKYIVEKGVCSRCGRTVITQSLTGQTVTLSRSVQLLVPHLVSMVGMSYTQVAHLLRAPCGVHISDGEVAHTRVCIFERYLIGFFTYDE